MKKLHKRRAWTEEERRQLRELYPNRYTKEVAELMKRTERSLYGMATLLCIHKSEAFLKKVFAEQGQRLTKQGAGTRFAKGTHPHNKGQKMPAETYEKCAPTMFRKGNEPHTTKYDGYERISKDGYIEVRIRKGKFMLKHRLVWETANGPVPPGHIVGFKDRDSKNLALENLELITRAENMARNSIHNYPEELKETIWLKGKLNRKINSKIKALNDHEKQD